MPSSRNLLSIPTEGEKEALLRKVEDTADALAAERENWLVITLASGHVIVVYKKEGRSVLCPYRGRIGHRMAGCLLYQVSLEMPSDARRFYRCPPCREATGGVEAL
jgi:hypothetical protein